MIFRFDQASHTYYGDDKVMPSVTQILKAAGKTGYYRGTKARDRGTAIHEATETWDALEIMPNDPEIVPYIQAWQKFMEQTKATILESEQAVYHQELWYAGTFDRILEIYGERILLDLKSGAKAPWHRIQLGAYNLALSAPCDRGIVLYLKPTGNFSADHFTDLHLATAAQEFKALRGNYVQ